MGKSPRRAGGADTGLAWAWILYLRLPAGHRRERIPGPGLLQLGSAYLVVFSRSVVSNSAIPRAVARQASLSMGILQAGILEWTAIPFSRGSS